MITDEIDKQIKEYKDFDIYNLIKNENKYNYFYERCPKELVIYFNHLHEYVKDQFLFQFMSDYNNTDTYIHFIHAFFGMEEYINEEFRTDEDTRKELLNDINTFESKVKQYYRK